MTIAIAQMRVTAGKPKQNKDAMLEMIAAAKAQQAEIILFPELSVSGLLIGDLAQNPAFRRECEACGEEIAAAATDIRVVYGNLDWQNGAVNNSVFLAANGENGRLSVPMGRSLIHGAYSRFAPSRDFQVYHLPIDEKIFRIGFLLGDWRYDGLPYTTNEIDLLIDLSNKPLYLNKNVFPHRIEGRQLLSLNCVGMQNTGKTNYLFGGGSYYLNFDGSLIARGETLASGLYLWQRQGGVIYPAWEENKLLGEALVTGVRAFASLIHAERAVIGLSGGIDSALAACVYTQALGPENVYLATMPANFSSGDTNAFAVDMAAALGANFAVFPIQEKVKGLMDSFSQYPFANAKGEALPLSFPPAAQENMQAWERGQILATAAAANDAIFACKANKIELAVGHATKYGDFAGDFAVQGDLWKYQVYQVASYFQQLYPEAPLDRIVAFGPSSAQPKQPDNSNGFDNALIYPYHDCLLRFWIEQNADLSETLACYEENTLEQAIGCQSGFVSELFPTAADFITDLEYWWGRYRGIGLAKRIQAPPILALSCSPFGEEKVQCQGALYISAEYQKRKEALLTN